VFVEEEVFKPMNCPTEQKMKSALRVHCFIVEERDGQIKALAVAPTGGVLWSLGLCVLGCGFGPVLCTRVWLGG
jgi:hypothetical protein